MLQKSTKTALDLKTQEGDPAGRGGMWGCLIFSGLTQAICLALQGWGQKAAIYHIWLLIIHATFLSSPVATSAFCSVKWNWASLGWPAGQPRPHAHTPTRPHTVCKDVMSGTAKTPFQLHSSQNRIWSLERQGRSRTWSNIKICCSSQEKMIDQNHINATSAELPFIKIDFL